MTDEEIRKIIDERDYLLKELDKEKHYQEIASKYRFKGYAAGNITRCVGTYTIENRLLADVESVKKTMMKMANNPALSEEVHKTMDKAVFYVDQYLEYRRHFYELLDTSNQLRSLAYRKDKLKRKLEQEK